jgi:hypothetical protein
VNVLALDGSDEGAIQALEQLVRDEVALVLGLLELLRALLESVTISLN